MNYLASCKECDDSIDVVADDRAAAIAVLRDWEWYNLSADPVSDMMIDGRCPNCSSRRWDEFMKRRLKMERPTYTDDQGNPIICEFCHVEKANTKIVHFKPYKSKLAEEDPAAHPFREYARVERVDYYCDSCRQE